MENIRFGKLGASDEEVYAAAREANAHEFITSFPEGYDTIVGERRDSVWLGSARRGLRGQEHRRGIREGQRRTVAEEDRAGSVGTGCRYKQAAERGHVVPHITSVSDRLLVGLWQAVPPGSVQVLLQCLHNIEIASRPISQMRCVAVQEQPATP